METYFLLFLFIWIWTLIKCCLFIVVDNNALFKHGVQMYLTIRTQKLIWYIPVQSKYHNFNFQFLFNIFIYAVISTED